MTTLYVAGPMSNLPEHNYPAFFAAAARLEAIGYGVVNPAASGVVDGWTWQDYMRRSLTELLTADGVALLPGWERSPGALIECRVAWDLGMPTFTVDSWVARARYVATRSYEAATS